MNFSEQKIKKNYIKSSFLSWGLLALLIALLAVGANAQSYPCTNAIYFTSSDNTNVYRYMPSTNAITQLSGVSINYGSTTSGSAGAALTPDGSRLYFNDRISPRQLRYNVGNTNNPIAALQPDNSGNAQRNGIDPYGTGYFMIGTAGSGAYYRYTTGGTTSTVSSGTLTVQPATAPALGTGGDITFDSNGIAYLLDQAKNFYRLDFTNNVANYLGTVTGMGAESPNGVGFSQTNAGVYELYVSTLNNVLYRINLATMVATVVTPASTVSGFTQNDIASCIYPPNITPNIAATKAWRNVTKGDAVSFTTSTAASLGDTLEYRIVVRNTGAIAAGNMTFQDTIPGGVTYVAGTTTLNGAAVTDSTGTGNDAFFYGATKTIQSYGQTANSGALKVDSTPATLSDNEAVVTFRVTVNNPFNGTAPIPNYAQVNYAGASSPINSNTVTTPVNLPELQIAKSHTGNFTAGGTETYIFTVTNTGTASSSGTITVSDTLPAGLTVNNGTAGAITEGGTNAAKWICNSNAATPQVITCTSSTAISYVSGSNASVFSFPVNVGLATAVGTNSITNTASVTGNNDSNTANNSASDPTTVLSPNLAIAKTHTGSFMRGGAGIYTITVTNDGTASTLANVIVTDTLPTGLSVNGGLTGIVTPGGTNAANWACNSNAATPQVITCTSSTAISNVSDSNASVFSISVNVAANAAASVTNNVSVSGGNEATANNGNNSASDPTATNTNPPNIALLKSCSSPANCQTAAQTAGTNLTYTIQFTNSGGQAATGMTVIDAIPANTDFKIGTATTSAGTTGLIFTIEYSNNYDALNPTSATWAYAPSSANGGAASGYDRNVKAIRWRVTSGSLSNISPNNTGNISFTVEIR